MSVSRFHKLEEGNINFRDKEGRTVGGKNHIKWHLALILRCVIPVVLGP